MVKLFNLIMSKNFKIAILGAGYMAEEYLKVLAKRNIFCETIYSRTLSKCQKLKKSIKLKNFQKV